jgi:hypothetical protein
MRRYLIVANQTLGGEQLTAKLTACMNAGPCRFYLVAPVTQTEASDQWAAGGLDGGVVPGAYKIARALAAGRLKQELARLQEAGAEADGGSSTPTPSMRSASWPAGRRSTRSSCPRCRGACPAGWRWICPTVSGVPPSCR